MNLNRRGVEIAVFALLFMSLACQKSSAQEANALCIGTFHSPKGFGLSVQTQPERPSFDSVSLIADLRGVISGDSGKPGIKLTYTRDIIFAHRDYDGMGLDLYAGPGLTAGYVHDQAETLHPIAGVSGVWGGRFTFDRHFTINLEFGCDLAYRMSKNERYGNIDLSTYKSGLYHIYYPQLLIHWRF